MLQITIDTREQMPWAFPAHLAETRRAKIDAGDYAITGDERNFAIERKSLPDFVSTIVRDWDRFQRELQRMENMPARVVVVESIYADILAYDYDSHKFSSAFVLSRIAQLTLAGVAVVFAGDPVQAMGFAYTIFRERNKELN